MHDDENLIHIFAEKLFTAIYGANYSKALSPKILENFVSKRKIDLKIKNTIDYIQLVNSDPDEREKLLSELTIHTTYWFRESRHFNRIEFIAREFKEKRPFEVFCLGCSTGEEVYSLAMVLESVKLTRPTFEYKITGIDIDLKTINRAKKGLYSTRTLKKIPKEYHGLIDVEGETFGVKQRIREKIRFMVGDAQKIALPKNDYDLALCRNLLIYFCPSIVKEIFYSCLEHVKKEGHLILGHCDVVEGASENPAVKLMGNSIYQKRDKSKLKHKKANSDDFSLKHLTRKILVVEDDEGVAAYIKESIANSSYEIDIATKASQAIELMKEQNYDLIVLDYNLGETNGIELATKLVNSNNDTPIIMVSGEVNESILEKYNDGNIVDFIQKPFKEDLLKASVKNALLFGKRPKNNRKKTVETQSKEVILIGVSTGGPSALKELLADFPSHFPPIIVVQHIDDKFAPDLSQELILGTGLNLKRTREGHREMLTHGDFVFTEGDYHFKVGATKEGVFVRQDFSEKTSGFRPSVDVLFESASKIKEDIKVTTIVLTGMGRDGSWGLRLLNERVESYNIAQDEESSVVFGMPKRAIETGAVNYVGNIKEIRSKMFQLYKGFNVKTAS